MVFVFEGVSTSHNAAPQDVALTDVLLEALSLSAYDLARSDPPSFSQSLSGIRILRGETLDYASYVKNISEGANNIEGLSVDPLIPFLVRSTEPVNQGYIKAGCTRISVLHLDGLREMLNETMQRPAKAEEDSLEIDETFLGNAMITTTSHSLVSREG